MRLYNWESRLSAYVASISQRGFAWGEHDCALFAAGGVEAVTGADPARSWRGAYASATGGLRLLRQAGFGDHVACAAALYPAIPMAVALPGDLAVLPAEDGVGALGIVQGEMIYVLRPDGLGLVPLSAATLYLAVR